MRFFLLIILFTMFLPFASGCKLQLAETKDFRAENEREVTDDLGRKIRIPAKIERVVSLAPNLTENVFAIGAGEKLVGVTSYCDYPAEAQKIQKIGDTINPNLEAIIAQKPQLVLVTTASQIESFTKRMDERGIAVFVTNPKKLEDVLRNLKQLGDLLGTGEKAEKLVADLQHRIETIENKTKTQTPLKVFVQISREPLFTIGRDSFVTDLVRQAGGVSVTADVPEAYPKISKETALAAQPEAIILTVGNAMGEGNEEPAEIFKDSPAVKNAKVLKINGDFLARPSPRLVDGLEQMAQGLHPSVF